MTGGDSLTSYLLTEPTPIEKVRALLYLPVDYKERDIEPIIQQLDLDQLLQLVHLRVVDDFNTYTARYLCSAASKRLLNLVSPNDTHLQPQLEHYLKSICRLELHQLETYYRHTKDEQTTGFLCKLLASFRNERAAETLTEIAICYPFNAELIMKLMTKYRLPITSKLVGTIEANYHSIPKDSTWWIHYATCFIEYIKDRLPEQDRSELEAILALLKLSEKTTRRTKE